MVHEQCRGRGYTYTDLQGATHVIQRCRMHGAWCKVQGARCMVHGAPPRAEVGSGQVAWSVEWPGYSPASLTAPSVAAAVWADPDVRQAGFLPKWNQIDGTVGGAGRHPGQVCAGNFHYFQTKTRRQPALNPLIAMPYVWEQQVNRTSHEGEYEVDAANLPLNPRGRTGLAGRGMLGRWGPNHAADPVVTRWRREPVHGELVTSPATGRRVLEFICIQRRDNGVWSLPGGMVDPGERVATTLVREFMEEALDTTDTAQASTKELRTRVTDFFRGGVEVRCARHRPRCTAAMWTTLGTRTTPG